MPIFFRLSEPSVIVQSHETVYPPLLLTTKFLAAPAFDISQDQLVHKVMISFFLIFVKRMNHKAFLYFCFLFLYGSYYCVHSMLGNSFRAPVDCKLPKGTTRKTLKNIHLPSNKDLKDQKFSSFGVPMI